MHLVHVDDLDSVYRTAFDPAMLATTMVCGHECVRCHRVEIFATPT